MLEYKLVNDVINVSVNGTYQNEDVPTDLFETIKSQKINKISVDLKKLTLWDSSLLVMLYKLKTYAIENHISFDSKDFPNGVQELINLSFAVSNAKTEQAVIRLDFLEKLGNFGLNIFNSFLRGFSFTLLNIKTLFKACFHKTVTRPTDFLFSLQAAGPEALPIVLLISFMVGLILAFVGAVQLQTFGAEVYVASLVTIGMIRIMGAIMVGIIMAGRTGSSFAATLGTMQAGEEIDALKTMGIPTNEFLVLPRLSALILTMPILTMLADFAGILGGAFVGVVVLDIPWSEFLKYTLLAWSIKNFSVGLFHSFVFAFIIALSGCYFGIYSGRDASSVGTATTKSVVYGIVWMIVATGIITLIFQRIGI